MRNTYLIQRLHKPILRAGKAFINPFNFGGGFKNGGLSDEAMGLLSKICSFDYMGAAEFEFGAVPEALQKIAKSSIAGTLRKFETIVGDSNKVFVICPAEIMAEVKVLLNKLYNDKEVRLKEHCGLREYFKGSPYGKTPNVPSEYDKKNCGWLELDDGFLFFADKEMYEQFSTLFNPSEEIK